MSRDYNTEAPNPRQRKLFNDIFKSSIRMIAILATTKQRYHYINKNPESIVEDYLVVMKRAELAGTYFPLDLQQHLKPNASYTLFQLAYLVAYYQVFGLESLSGLLLNSNFTGPSLTITFPTWHSSPYNPATGVKEGEMVYIHGPKYASAFKPNSAFNGFNALCVESTTREPKFIAVHSPSQEAYTLDELKKFMIEKYRKPLTYMDVWSVFKHSENTPLKQCPMTTFSRRTAWNMLVWTNSEKHCSKLLTEISNAEPNEKQQLFNQDAMNTVIPASYLEDATCLGIINIIDVLTKFYY
ncbi:hypothetical protein B7494_g8426 [Chlorociboria aeruginascens]|nr:hypothetical protein B7494_g8426 [Chlorociboria aeruginascens]